MKNQYAPLTSWHASRTISENKEMSSKVWVIGSAVLDRVHRVKSLPTPGQAVFAQSATRFLGGKGSNQAIASIRSGATTGIIGCLGEDEPGEQFLRAYIQEGLDTTHMRQTPDLPTGSAHVAVDDTGLNQITVNVGSNAALTAQDVLDAPIFQEDFVLCQFEVQNEVIEAAAQRGSFILNPAPMRDVPLQFFNDCFAVTPNQTEAEAIVGFPVVDIDSAARAGVAILDLGAHNVIITLGQDGAFWTAPGTHHHFPAPKVEAIDSTGAGDVFNGTFVARLALGDEIPEAISYAVKAAAISVTRPGAIPSVPTATEVNSLS